MGRAITESVWRNDVPVAPELYIDAYRGRPVDISLRDYLVQGAREIVRPSGTPEEIEQAEQDADDKQTQIIAEKGARRGWACSYFNISRPGYGRLSNSIYADGFRYTSLPNFIGEDCFSYVINNGFQNSLPGKVIVNVQNYMEGRIIIEEDLSRRTPTRRALRYIAQWYIPPEFGTFSHIGVTWFEHRPVRFLKDGVTHIRIEKRQVSSTVFTSTSTNNLGFRYVSQNYTYPSDGSFISTTWPDTSVNGAINEANGMPYQQPNGPWPVSVEITFRRQKVESYLAAVYRYNSSFPTYVTRWRTHWELIESVEADVRTLYGDGWWRDGRIQGIQDPSFTPSIPGPFTPDLSSSA